MITEKELIAMQEYYSAKCRALHWYKQAMNSVNDELILSCLFCWQYASDEATKYWKQIKEENQVRLTFISIGHQI